MINLKRLYFSLILKADYMSKSFRRRNNIHLMDRVMYNGEEYFVNNGTVCCGDCGIRLWSILSKEPRNDKSKRKGFNVPETYLTKINDKESRKYGRMFYYNFMMTNWYSIHLNKKNER